LPRSCQIYPLATLAAVLFVVAYNMANGGEIGGILRLSKTDINGLDRYFCFDGIG